MDALPSRPGRWAAAATVVAQAVVDLDLERWDVICVLGVLCLFTGLWIWVGLGIALTAIGALLLGLGIAGARHAAPLDHVTADGRL